MSLAFGGHLPPASSVGLFQPECICREYHLHDIRGPFEDLVYLSVAKYSGYGVFIGIPICTQDLQAQVGDFVRSAGCIKLSQYSLPHVVDQTTVLLKGASPDQRSGRLCFSYHPRDNFLDHLEFGNWTAELPALVRVFDGRVQSCLATSHRAGRGSKARADQFPHEVDKAFSLLTNEVASRDLYILHNYFPGRAGPDTQFVFGGDG